MFYPFLPMFSLM
uniref:Uncharacterized protein n=1 Tax=Arundo donax TaxID=35708 RepID=A0A0A9FTG5_ARUDO